MNLNELAKVCHKANEKWWIDLHTKQRIVREKDELFMLMVSELSEALEGERKNLMDDKLPHRKMAEVEMVDVLIRALDYVGGFNYTLVDVPVWLDTEFNRITNRPKKLLQLTKLVCAASDAEERGDTDAVILNLSKLLEGTQAYCRDYGYDLQGAFDEKMAFNAVRKDHTHEARLAAGGKAF